MLCVSIVIASQKLSTRCVLCLFLCVSAQVVIVCIRSNRSWITEFLCDYYAQGQFARASQCQLVAVAGGTNFYYR